MRHPFLLLAKVVTPALCTLAAALSLHPLAQDPSLIAHYRFEGSTVDSSGHQKPGVPKSGAAPCEDRHGKADAAYCFHGPYDYIDVGKGLKPGFPITVLAWIKPYTLTGGRGVFRNDYAGQGGGIRGGIEVFLINDALGGAVWNGSGSDGSNSRRHSYTSAGAIPNTGWHHVAFVFQGVNTRRAYVDAIEVPLTSWTGTGTHMDYTTASGAIGHASSGDGSYYFSGAIDEILVFSRALSEPEIFGYAYGVPTFTKRPQSLNVLNGSMANFSVEAAAAAPFEYQWFHKAGESERALQDQTNRTLTITPVIPFFAGQYYAIASNSWGVATSPPARLHVSEIIPEWGHLLTFRYPGGYGKAYEVVSAPSVPWHKREWKPETAATPGAGATFASDVKPTGSNQFFQIRESDTSMPAAPDCVVNGEPPLRFLSQPADQRVPDGGTARFSVTVGGQQPVDFQWWGLSGPLTDDAQFFSGTKTCTLTIRNVMRLLAGDYHVVATDGASPIASRTAHLAVSDLRTTISLGAKVSFPAEVGKVYQVEYSPNLDEPTWSSLGEPVRAAEPIVAVDFTNASPSQVNFRAKVVPSP